MVDQTNEPTNRSITRGRGTSGAANDAVRGNLMEPNLTENSDDQTRTRESPTGC